MQIARSVRARLVERFIFNFRLRPTALASILPVSYLTPQVFHGWGVVSFCLLKLDQVMLSPLPAWPNIKTTSCAYRCGVMDTSGAEPVPSVYIPARYTDLALISQLGPRIFSSAIPRICASFSRQGAGLTIGVSRLDRRRLFAAEIQPSPNSEVLNSCLFGSIDAFAHFIANGVSSYTPATRGDALARVDLRKDATCYEALNATVVYSSLNNLWHNEELIFDSAVRATGGLYEWTYLGLAERSSNYLCQV